MIARKEREGQRERIPGAQDRIYYLKFAPSYLLPPTRPYILEFPYLPMTQQYYPLGPSLEHMAVEGHFRSKP
jgi:hypothetical protein